MLTHIPQKYDTRASYLEVKHTFISQAIVTFRKLFSVSVSAWRGFAMKREVENDKCLEVIFPYLIEDLRFRLP